MKRTILPAALIVVFLLLSGSPVSGEIRSAGVKGNWSASETWQGNVVPGPTDLVTIIDGDTVTIDGGAITIAGLTVGEGDITNRARIKFSTTTSVNLTINGDLTVSDSSAFSVQSNTTFGLNLVDSLIITGNITSTGKFVLKAGSGGSNTITIMNVVFTGSGNSVVTIPAPYSTQGHVWGGITVNKSGTGRVILNSEVYMPGGTSLLIPATANPLLHFVRGVVETRAYALIYYWTVDSISGASDSSYVLGTFGRAMSSGSLVTRLFPVGDQKGYRPIKIHNFAGGGTTGHIVKVACISGDANLAGSTFSGAIDRISSVRYYKVTYYRNYSNYAASPGGTAAMPFDKFTLSYGLNDGVASDNQNLRVATGDSARSIWTASGPTTHPHTTSLELDSLPRFISGDTLATAITVADGNSIYLALARLSGSTENLLGGSGTWVQQTSDIPMRFSLDQNYPNPFNPSTTIRFQLDKPGLTTVNVYDALGREVAILVERHLQGGTYTATWDAEGFATGIYYYRLLSGNRSETRKMLLLK